MIVPYGSPEYAGLENAALPKMQGWKGLCDVIQYFIQAGSGRYTVNVLRWGVGVARDSRITFAYTPLTHNRSVVLCLKERSQVK